MNEQHPLTQIIIFGASGRLGRDIHHFVDQQCFAFPGGCHVSTPEHENTDISNYGMVFNYLSRFEGTEAIVVNCAAKTDVVKIEVDQEYRDEAYKVNVNGVRNIAYACKEFGFRFLQIGSDFEWSEHSRTFPPTYELLEHPLNVYGYQKFLGEEIARGILGDGRKFRTVRCSWLFGDGNTDFPTRILVNSYLSRRTKHSFGTTDTKGWPIWTKILASDIVGNCLLREWKNGEIKGWLGFGDECVSRFDLAQMTLSAWNTVWLKMMEEGRDMPAFGNILDVSVLPTTSDKVNCPVRHPSQICTDTSPGMMKNYILFTDPSLAANMYDYVLENFDRISATIETSLNTREAFGEGDRK